jgi:hypothetical protein
VNFVRRSQTRIKKILPAIAAAYGVADGSSKSILEVAMEVNYPPVQLARLLLEALTKLPAKARSDFIREPAAWRLGEDHAGIAPRLIAHVQEVLAKDPLYGPRHDYTRYADGVEFEVVLEHKLQKLGTCFSSLCLIDYNSSPAAARRETAADTCNFSTFSSPS